MRPGSGARWATARSLFVDEIHRFNRAQQDAFLPVVEDGTVVLVGATTENPSFELIGALLSRAQVLILRRLGDDDLETLLRRAEEALGRKLPLTDDARTALRAMADGDGRFLLNLVEEIARLPPGAMLGPTELARLVQQRAPLYDKAQEGHYNLISALHKSLRGSDTDAALYWLARMMAGGEDPIYILRRLTRAAVEDIGLADPQAVVQALAAWDTYDRLGSPEGELAIAQCVIYLATAPKSNAAYTRLWRGATDGARDRLVDAADAHPERADAADAQSRLRQGLCLRPRHRGRLLGPELLPGRDRASHLLPTGRARLRARSQKAARLLGQAARACSWTVAMTDPVETVTVDGQDGPVRVDRWFRRHYPALAHGRLEKLLRTGQIRVDGKRAKAGDRVMPGQAIRVPPLDVAPSTAVGAAPRQVLAAPTRRCCGNAILHHDESVIVINKPPGLAVQGGTRSERHLDGLLDGAALWPRRAAAAGSPARQGYQRRPASSPAAPRRRRFLTRAFRDKTTRKIYWALVVGLPKPPQGRIDLALAKRRRPGRRTRPRRSPTTASTRSPITASSTASASG